MVASSKQTEIEKDECMDARSCWKRRYSNDPEKEGGLGLTLLC